MPHLHTWTEWVVETLDPHGDTEEVFHADSAPEAIAIARDEGVPLTQVALTFNQEDPIRAESLGKRIYAYLECSPQGNWDLPAAFDDGQGIPKAHRKALRDALSPQASPA